MPLRQRNGRTLEHAHYGRRAYLVLTVFTYQVTLGLSLRWYDRAPHLRVYMGPFKLAAGGIR